MKILHMIAAVLMIAGMSAPAAAQGNFLVEANLAYVDKEWGGELGAGFGVNIGVLRLRAVGGAFLHEGDNDRYSRQTFNNGQSRCRDSRNGQFADDDLCSNTAAEFYARAEAAFAVGNTVEIGGGARFGGDEDVVPFGTIGFRLSPSIMLRGNGGPDYFAAGLMVDF